MGDNVTAVEQVSGLMAGIADASTQQTAGIQEINRTIAVMEQMTQQNAALVEEASASAEQLGHLADELVHAVSVFKVTGSAHAPVRTIVPREEASAAAGQRTREAHGTRRIDAVQDARRKR